MAQNNNSGVENGNNGNKQWELPSENRWTTCQQNDKSLEDKYKTGRMQHPRRHRISSLPAKPSHERRNIGGPGMQAIFLGCNRTSGTGVFLPRIEGSDAHLLTNKPALPPVLLPYRVVQTLNLNLNEVGKKMKPQTETDQPKSTAKRNENRWRNKQQEVEYISPDIYLPKEWTY